MAVLPILIVVAGCSSEGTTGPGGAGPARILFTSARADSAFEQLYTVGLDGSGLRQVTSGHADHERAAVSPDGSKALLAALGGTEPNGIFLLNIDGSNPRPVLLGADYVWSPDGARVASLFLGDNMVSALAVSNPDGTGRIDLAADQNNNLHPSWSPGGTKLTYQKLRLDINSTPHIYVVNADGSGTKALTDGTSTDELPAWSPAGDRLAFLSTWRDDGSNLNLMDSTGGSLVNLPVRCGNQGPPQWSPDGAKIACIRDAASPITWQELLVTNADGSGLKVLLQSPHLAFPSWSPDGNWILFEGWLDGRYDAYVVHADGTGLANVTHDPYAAFQPVWVRTPE